MNNNHFVSNVIPLNKQATSIYNNKDFALLAISPFNAYYSFERILTLVEWAADIFDDFAFLFLIGYPVILYKA